MITVEDIADRVIHHRWYCKFQSMELIGDNKTFGHILIDGKHKINIFINDETNILDAIFDFMLKPAEHIEAAIERKLEIIS